MVNNIDTPNKISRELAKYDIHQNQCFILADDREKLFKNLQAILKKTSTYEEKLIEWYFNIEFLKLWGIRNNPHPENINGRTLMNIAPSHTIIYAKPPTESQKEKEKAISALKEKAGVNQAEAIRRYASENDLSDTDQIRKDITYVKNYKERISRNINNTENNNQRISIYPTSLDQLEEYIIFNKSHGYKLF